MRRNYLRISTDIIMTGTLAALCFLRYMPVIVHELLAVIFTISLVVHLAVNFRTLFSSGKTDAESKGITRRGVMIINLLTGLSLAVNIISGFMMSELFPALNLGLSWTYRLHAYSYAALMVLVALHLASHYTWIKNAVKTTWNGRPAVIVLGALLCVACTCVCFAAAEVMNVGAKAETPPLTVESTLPEGGLGFETTAAPASAASETAATTTQKAAASTTTTQKATTAAPNTTASSSESGALPVFTAETLAAYNGKNGMPAYMAVNGVVYDVSSYFKNGQHKGYSAGTDLTEYFYKYHSDNMLKSLTVVGTYE